MATGGPGGSASGSSDPGSESLNQARLVGDTFSGDVYWNDDSEAIFGRSSSATDLDYLRIYSDKAAHLQVFDSTKIGTGTVRPMSWQMDGDQKMLLDTDGGLVVGAATGGSKGDGTVNISGNYYINGVAIATAGNAWVQGGNLFGAAGTLGTLDNNNVRIIRNGVEYARYVLTGGGLSTVTFVSDLPIPGDNIIQWFNTDNTADAQSSMELQLNGDIATLEMYVLCSNNVSYPDPRLDGADKNAVVYGAVNASLLAVWTPDAVPIWLITNSTRRWFVDATSGGITPDLDASVVSQDLGQDARRWNQVLAYNGNFKDGLTVGTAGTATTRGEMWMGVSGGQSFRWHEAGGYDALILNSAAANGVIVQLQSNAGAGHDTTAGFVMINTEGRISEITVGDTGSSNYYFAKANWMTIGSGNMLGLRITTGLGGSPEAITIDPNQHVTIVNDMVVGAAAGGFQGPGTINVATDIYKNGVAYANPDYVFEHWATGEIRKFAANDGAASYKGRPTLEALEAHCRENLRLPGITSDPMGVFGRTDFLLEKVEEIFTYLFDLNRRVLETVG